MTDERRVRGRKRSTVAERAGRRCEYCRCPEYIGTQKFAVEHIVPFEQTQESNLQNLALACQGCNNHKYIKREARDPLTQELVPLYHPRKQKWSDHFAWNEDTTLVRGLTPTGRATVEALQLNRTEVVNFRRVLYHAGEHPPLDPAEESKN
jgi:pyruvate-formate lyase-activating enzyme